VCASLGLCVQLPCNYHVQLPGLCVQLPLHPITTQTIGIVKQAQPGTPVSVQCISALFKLFGKPEVIKLTAEQGLDVFVGAQGDSLFE